MDEFFNFRADSVLIHTVSLLQAVQEMVVDSRLDFSFGPSIKDVGNFFSSFVIPPSPMSADFYTYLLAKLVNFVPLPSLYLTVFVDNPFLILEQLCHFASV